MATVMSEVVRSYSDPQSLFSAFEGINEPNNNGVPWIAETREKTRSLYAQRAIHGLEAVPIVGPALARVTHGGVQGHDTQQQSAELGDLSPWIDRGNIHVYPRGRTPSEDLDAFISWQRLVCADKPIFNTEGGYFATSNYTGGAWPVSEKAVRQYVPREVMENWIRNIGRFFLYELLDDPIAAASARESNFGMIQVPSPDAGAPWTPKPHYYAMKNFLQILADPGPPHLVEGLACRLLGGSIDLRHSLVQKRNGDHFLCLWRDVSVYNTNTRSSVPVVPLTIDVVLERPANVVIYKPSTQPGPVRSHVEVLRFPVSLAGELVICEVSPPTDEKSSVVR
jgi:hypothetical protein